MVGSLRHAALEHLLNRERPCQRRLDFWTLGFPDEVALHLVVKLSDAHGVDIPATGVCLSQAMGHA